MKKINNRLILFILLLIVLILILALLEANLRNRALIDFMRDKCISVPRQLTFFDLGIVEV